MSTDTLAKLTATVVPDDRREMFLPTLFGRKFLLVGENAVYNVMQLLSPYDYRGGFWNFYEIDGQPLFLAPTSKPRFRIESGITDYRGEVSAEAAGIIATMFVFSHLSIRFESDFLAQNYDRLYGYFPGHPEASAIFQAID